MRVLLLGATGTIGSAVLDELLQHGYSVLALARSDTSAQKIIDKGADVIMGNLKSPQQWSESIQSVDAIIHLAATFCDDMAEIYRRVIDELIEQSHKLNQAIRFIYTGGVWLYGETGDTPATEQSTLNPIASFEWMVPHGQRLFNAPYFNTSIIHPGIAYEQDGGVLSSFIPVEERIEVWGSFDTRWPVVHTKDLAKAYRLVLEQGKSDSEYNVCSEQGVTVGDIAMARAKKFNLIKPPRVLAKKDVLSEQGEWALGPMLDQCMSAEKIINELGWHPDYTSIVSVAAK
jgi:nucleoside-diphosphate-sugar epimerase